MPDHALRATRILRGIASLIREAHCALCRFISSLSVLIVEKRTQSAVYRVVADADGSPQRTGPMGQVVPIDGRILPALAHSEEVDFGLGETYRLDCRPVSSGSF